MAPELGASARRSLSLVSRLASRLASRLRGSVIFAAVASLSVVALVGHAESAPRVAVVTAPDAPWIEESRIAAKDFAMSLRARLQSGLQQGPVEAIEICHREAFDIAAEVGAKHERRVSRSSSRVRNPNNSADELDQKIIASFQDRLAAGESAANIEFIEDHGVAGKIFAKPLMMDAVCLMCHGDSVPPEVSAAIKSLYPADEATGFKLGELRGILRVDQTVNKPVN